jgi:hypothetical protein
VEKSLRAEGERGKGSLGDALEHTHAVSHAPALPVLEEQRLAGSHALEVGLHFSSNLDLVDPVHGSNLVVGLLAKAQLAGNVCLNDKLIGGAEMYGEASKSTYPLFFGG